MRNAHLFCLAGKARADWGEGPKLIGKRANVFDGFPYAIYLPADHEITLTGETVCEIAECQVLSTAKLEPRLITPSAVVTSLRGGGNASRQIVDIIKPDFPADKLVVIEAYTPGGNWSSYPPHKHDVHNPPVEWLDEIYYYRIELPKKDLLCKGFTPQISRETSRCEPRTAMRCWCIRVFIRWWPGPGITCTT